MKKDGVIVVTIRYLSHHVLKARAGAEYPRFEPLNPLIKRGDCRSFSNNVNVRSGAEQ